MTIEKPTLKEALLANGWVLRGFGPRQHWLKGAAVITIEPNRILATGGDDEGLAALNELIEKGILQVGK